MGIGAVVAPAETLGLTCPRVKLPRNVSPPWLTLRRMTESAPIELCDCPRRDHVDSADGHCTLPSIRSEEVDYSRYSQCGCCMADCPDAHPESGRGLRAVPGSAVIAQEYVDTLPEEKQQALREQEARGELRIAPQAEMRLPGRD